MTDPLGTAGLLLVASAAIFGPLTGWLAGRRARNPLVWLVFGALLGPLAVAILLVGPPGRCPLCDTPVAGWPADCAACGGPIPARVALGTWLTGPPPARPGHPPQVPTTPIVAPPGSPSAASSGLAGVAGWPPATATNGSAAPARGSMAAMANVHPAAAAGARRPFTPTVNENDHLEEILATGICFGGTTRLIAGARYVVARREGLLRLRGPVDIDPTRVALERPLPRLSATAFGDRIVITESDGDRVSMALALGSLAGANAEQLERLLREAAAPGIVA